MAPKNGVYPRNSMEEGAKMLEFVVAMVCAIAKDFVKMADAADRIAKNSHQKQDYDTKVVILRRTKKER